MKTTCFNMDLMVPNQINKDVVFNESLLKIDSFLNSTVNGFIEDIPDNLEIGEKYIITSGKYTDHICYMSHESKGVQYFLPKQGMLVFSLKTHNFLLYISNQWQEIQLNSYNESNANIAIPSIDKNFTDINELFEAPADKSYLYLYLNGNTTLGFEQITIPELTIMIKQCYNASYALTWPENIIWENKAPHTMTKAPNATDLIKLYQLPETKHFLGKIIAQNYQF